MLIFGERLGKIKMRFCSLCIFFNWGSHVNKIKVIYTLKKPQNLLWQSEISNNLFF